MRAQRSSRCYQEYKIVEDRRLPNKIVPLVAGSAYPRLPRQSSAEFMVSVAECRPLWSCAGPSASQLSKLRHLSALSGARRGIAPNARPQQVEIDEGIGLTPQFVRNHWRLSSQARHDGNPNAPSLERFH